jgi:hypothetical protein
MIPFDQLLVGGCVDQLPEHRKQPSVVSAILLDPVTRHYHFPPFEVRDNALVPSPHWLYESEFIDWHKQGHATWMPSVIIPARPDGCWLFPEGEGGEDYVSLKTACAHLWKFAEAKIREGDDFHEANQHQEALDCYAVAAAVSQHPDHYDRMLRKVWLMSKTRAKRIRDMFEESSKQLGRKT